jgi:hypothetical protein
MISNGKRKWTNAVEQQATTTAARLGYPQAGIHPSYMIPRFSNPHILEISTKHTTRADLHLGQEVQIDTANEDIPVLTKRLRELVRDDLGNVTFTTTEGNSRSKRRKLENISNDVEQETSVCAYLFVETVLSSLIDVLVLYSISTGIQLPCAA